MAKFIPSPHVRPSGVEVDSDPCPSKGFPVIVVLTQPLAQRYLYPHCKNGGGKCENKLVFLHTTAEKWEAKQRRPKKW